MEYWGKKENQSPFSPSPQYSIAPVLQSSSTPVLRCPRSPFSLPTLALGCLLLIAPAWSADVATTNGEYSRQLTAIRNREMRAADSIAEEQSMIAVTRQRLLDVEKRTVEVERTRALDATAALCEADSILGELELLRDMDRSRRDSLVTRLQARASALESSPAARLVGVRERLDRIETDLLEMRATRRPGAASVDR